MQIFHCTLTIFNLCPVFWALDSWTRWTKLDTFSSNYNFKRKIISIFVAKINLFVR